VLFRAIRSVPSAVRLHADATSDITQIFSPAGADDLDAWRGPYASAISELPPFASDEAMTSIAERPRDPGVRSSFSPAELFRWCRGCGRGEQRAVDFREQRAPTVEVRPSN
jgi:hypothetical protein